MTKGREELHRLNKEREAAGVPYVGYPAEEPCDVCTKVDMNQTEPRFGYTVCRHHAHLSPVEVGAQRAAREAAEARVASQRPVPIADWSVERNGERHGLTLQDRMTVWRNHTKNHPIHRQTDADVERPKGAASKMLGDYIAVPMPELGVIFWAFKRQVDADFFDANYPVIKSVGEGQ